MISNQKKMFVFNVFRKKKVEEKEDKYTMIGNGRRIELLEPEKQVKQVKKFKSFIVNPQLCTIYEDFEDIRFNKRARYIH